MDTLDALALRAQAGDERACEECLRRLGPIIRRESAAIYLPDGDADVVLAEATYWAWRAIHIWHPGGAVLTSMVNAIVRRKLQQLLRTATRMCRHAPQRPVPLDAAIWVDSPKTRIDHGDRLLPSLPSAEAVAMLRADRAEQRAVLQDYLGCLSPLERRVVLIRLATAGDGRRHLATGELCKANGIQARAADNAHARCKVKLLRWLAARRAK